MQLKKELLLFCTILFLAIGLLVASNRSVNALPVDKRCSATPSCMKKMDKKHEEISPWNFLTEGVLHITSISIINL